MIIDSQVHAYAANTPQRPWAKLPHGWPPHVTGDEMVAAMDKLGIDGAIMVSVFSMYRFDASYAMEVGKKHPNRLAMVRPVDPDNPAVEELIAEWKKTPGAVGIRVIVPEDTGRPADDPGFDRILRTAARLDLPVNLLFWRQTPTGVALIDRHPQTRFVLDHLGLVQPRTLPLLEKPWADLPTILDLAKRPNVVIKVSGAGTLSREPYPYPDIWDPLARVFDAWGFERCLWGTDWTRTYSLVNYEQATKPFLMTDKLSESERAMLMGGATAKVYGWKPGKK